LNLSSCILKVAFDSFEKLLLVTTQIYTSESSLACHKLSPLTTNQTRIVLMFHWWLLRNTRWLGYTGKNSWIRGG